MPGSRQAVPAALAVAIAQAAGRLYMYIRGLGWVELMHGLERIGVRVRKVLLQGWP